MCNQTQLFYMNYNRFGASCQQNEGDRTMFANELQRKLNCFEWESYFIPFTFLPHII